jgi:GTP-binding protein HflX
MDIWANETLPGPLEDADEYYAQVSVSAHRHTGIPQLLEAVEAALAANLYHVKLLVPYERGEMVSLLYKSASVQSQLNRDDGVLLDVRLPASLYLRFKAFQIVE